jgi:hypothetical protein
MRPSYHIFPDQATTQSALATLHVIMANIARDHGLTVLPNNTVVGKNAATGEDSPEGTTVDWSPPIPLENGLWGIPTVRERFPTLYAQVEAAASLPPPQEATPLSDTE